MPLVFSKENPGNPASGLYELMKLPNYLRDAWQGASIKSQLARSTAFRMLIIKFAKGSDFESSCEISCLSMQVEINS